MVNMVLKSGVLSTTQCSLGLISAFVKYILLQKQTLTVQFYLSFETLKRYFQFEKQLHYLKLRKEN